MLWIDWSDAFRMLLGEKGVAGASSFVDAELGGPGAPRTGSCRSGAVSTSARVRSARATCQPTPTATCAAWAYAAHAGIAAAAAEMVRYGTEATGQRVVALSGGVFMNRILTGLLAPRLEDLGLTVLLHRDTPPNDGCIAIGQAIVAGEAKD